MKKTQGFSLIELLVALVLISATSLALLAQQWQFSQSVSQLVGELSALIEIDNQKELTHSIRSTGLQK